MLVTFRTRPYADITMFGDVAVKLLKLMGHSGTVPSAIKAEDVPAALARLKAAIAEQRRAGAGQQPATGEGEGEGEEEPPVSIVNRALPLIELLEAAAAAKADVVWDG